MPTTIPSKPPAPIPTSTQEPRWFPAPIEEEIVLTLPMVALEAGVVVMAGLVMEWVRVVCEAVNGSLEVVTLKFVPE